MDVRVVRRGGLAGIALHGEVDTAELSRPIDDVLHRLPVDKPPAGPRHPDGFQYEIAFAEPNGHERSVVLDESEVSDDLQPLIQLAMQRGTLG